jgi:hypothetical protein
MHEPQVKVMFQNLAFDSLYSQLVKPKDKPHLRDQRM